MARVLLIDDRRASLDRAHLLLRDDGHELIEATDALAGLQRAVEDAPACVVVDLDLAGLGGLELCRQLAQEDATATVPVVVWGAARTDEAGPGVREAGAFAYVDRNRTAGALRGIVRRACTERRIGASGEVPPASTRPGSIVT